MKSFAAVVSYKDSNKRADALLKLGEIAERNNNAAQAKNTTNKLSMNTQVVRRLNWLAQS